MMPNPRRISLATPRAALLASAALAACAFAGPASANIVQTGSPTFSITDTVPISVTGGPAPLTATLTFSNFVVGGGTASMQIAVANQTNAALFPSGRLTAFGFDTDPNATGVGDNSAIFSTFLNTNFPSFHVVDVCASTGPTCDGGGGSNLAPGASNIFTLTLTGLPAGTTSLDLGANGSGPETFDFKWQTSIGSFESSCVFGGSCGSVLIPEPMTLTVLGAGLLGLGLMRRRGQR